MENCTIYSHRLKFDEVVDIVKSQLPKAQVEFTDNGKQKSLVATMKGGFFGKNKTLTINYRERENPSYKLDAIECGLTQNLAGMVNFIQSFPAQNNELRNKFLHKVMSANCEMPFMAEPSISPEFEHVLKQITNKLDAFTFAQPSKVFSKSNGQHFLDKELNLIIDANGNMEVSDISVSVDAKYHDEPQEDVTEEQIKRKQQSEIFLKQHDVKVNSNLPCCTLFSYNTSLRTKTEVIDRAYALLVIAARGEGVAMEQLNKLIEGKKIESFTPKETNILNSEELNDQDKTYATWRYESLYTILWSLNQFSELKYPSDICDVKEVVSKIFTPNKGEFEQQCSLRSKEEIVDELDKTYRMNWACVDARVQNQNVSGNLNPSIVYERHYALNWLTKYNGQDWDDVQTHT